MKPLLLALALSCLTVQACSQASDGPPPAVFACGQLNCVIGQQYCRKAFPGAVANPQESSHNSCEKLPLPDCAEVERSGRCLGSPETGLIVEIYFP